LYTCCTVIVYHTHTYIDVHIDFFDNVILRRYPGLDGVGSVGELLQSMTHGRHRHFGIPPSKEFLRDYSILIPLSSTCQTIPYEFAATVVVWLLSWSSSLVYSLRRGFHDTNRVYRNIIGQSLGWQRIEICVCVCVLHN